jgi:hypothetical protein
VNGLGSLALQIYGFDVFAGASAASIFAEQSIPPRLQHQSFFASDQPVVIS